MRAPFAGTSAFGAAVLRGLVERGVEVPLVLCQPDRPAGRKRRLTPPPVAALARELGLPLVQPERALEAHDALAATRPEAIAICAYGQLLPPSLLRVAPWLNLHPSLLPRWRGAAPIERALMAGDVESGVAIMRTEAELDAGPIVSVERFPIGPDDDADDVERRALAAGVPALAHARAAAQAGTLDWVPQATDGVTYAAKLERADRLIDPLADGALETANRVRALRPRIGALRALDGETTVVWRVASTQEPLAPGQVRVLDGTLAIGLWGGSLLVTELQSPGKRALPAADWLRGRRSPPVACTKPA
ncbi:MAG: methionyl-tRNA formyltransferase [Gaiellales bacterium]